MPAHPVQELSLELGARVEVHLVGSEAAVAGAIRRYRRRYPPERYATFVLSWGPWKGRTCAHVCRRREAIRDG